MPTTPKRTKKALQEIARTFNRLASDLTADLNEAIREIENLRHEVKSLRANRTTNRTTTSKPTRQTTTHRKTTSTSTPRTTTTTTAHHTTHSQSTATPDSSYVFPHEPFNPPAPPEPQAPGNN